MERTLERTFLYDLCENHTKNRAKVINDLEKFTKNTKTITKVAGVVIDNPITIKDHTIETLRETLVKQHAAHLELSEALKNHEIQYEGILPLDVFKTLVTEVLFTQNFFCFYNITDEGVVKIGIKDLSEDTIAYINSKDGRREYYTINTDILKDNIWPNFSDIQGVHHKTCTIVLPKAPIEMQKRLSAFRQVFPREQCGLLVHRDAFSIHEVNEYISELKKDLELHKNENKGTSLEEHYNHLNITIEDSHTIREKERERMRKQQEKKDQMTNQILADRDRATLSMRNNDPILFWITNDLVVILGQYGDIPEEKALMEKFTTEYFQVLCREKIPQVVLN